MPAGKPAPGRRTPEEINEAAERLARLAKDPRLVPGIYNYCDRWCERCPHTGRCLQFTTEQERQRRRGRRASRDVENREFWEELGDSLALALHLARREAKRRGIDLDSPGALDDAAAQIRRRRRRAVREGSALHRAATLYWKSARTLLDRLPVELRAIQEALCTQARLGTGDPEGTAVEISDALDVVQWYLFFIDVKLSRAVSSRVVEREEEPAGFPSDADGSAKVALIAIDRSLAAWARLRELLDGEADAILDLLVRLERLRRAAEREFPKARAFRRPGLD